MTFWRRAEQLRRGDEYWTRRPALHGSMVHSEPRGTACADGSNTDRRTAAGAVWRHKLRFR